MAISEFSMMVKRKINLGNYESLDVEASIKYQMADGDDYKAEREEARKELRSLLTDAYRAGKRANAQGPSGDE